MTINTVNKYRVWCVSENSWIDGWYVDEPDVCPHNNTHTINPSLTSIVERIDATISTDIFGKAKIHNTQRPPGTTTFFTGAADNPNILSDVGNVFLVKQKFIILNDLQEPQHFLLGLLITQTFYQMLEMANNFQLHIK